MTLIWWAGFENGLSDGVIVASGIDPEIFADYGGTRADVYIQNTVKRTGNYAMRVHSDSGSENGFMGVGFNPHIACHVGCFYVRFAEFPTSNQNITNSTVTGAGEDLAILFNATTKKFYPRFWGISSGTEVDVVAELDTWYRIDYKFDVSANPHTIDLKVNGVATTQHTLAGTATDLQAHHYGTADSGTIDLFFDDIVACNDAADYPFNGGDDYEIIGLRPAADGTHVGGTNTMEDNTGADITTPGYTTAHELLDDSPWTTGASDYAKQVTADTGKYIEVTFETLAADSVIAVSDLMQYNSAGANANAVGCSVIDEDAAEHEIWGDSGYQRDWSGTALKYLGWKIPAPAGGWDVAAVNAMKCRFGWANDVDSVPYLHNVILSVVAGIGGETALSINISPGNSQVPGLRIRS